MDQVMDDVVEVDETSPPTLEELVRLELQLLGAPDDHNVAALMAHARRLDALPDHADRHTAHVLARRLNALLLAVHWPFQIGAALPAHMHQLMRRRAAAVDARLRTFRRQSRPFPESRPGSISVDDVRPSVEKAAGGWRGSVLVQEGVEHR